MIGLAPRSAMRRMRLLALRLVGDLELEVGLPVSFFQRSAPW